MFRAMNQRPRGFPGACGVLANSSHPLPHPGRRHIPPPTAVQELRHRLRCALRPGRVAPPYRWFRRWTSDDAAAIAAANC
jgi:hypothetical protein